MNIILEDRPMDTRREGEYWIIRHEWIQPIKMPSFSLALLPSKCVFPLLSANNINESTIPRPKSTIFHKVLLSHTHSITFSPSFALAVFIFNIFPSHFACLSHFSYATLAFTFAHSSFVPDRRLILFQHNFHWCGINTIIQYYMHINEHYTSI